MKKSKQAGPERPSIKGAIPLPNDASSSWRSEFKKLQEENAALKRKFIDLKETYATKAKALRYYWKKSTDLQEKCKTFEETMKKLEGANSRLKDANSSLENEKHVLFNEKTALIERSLGLEKNNQGLEEKLSIKNVELERTQLKLKNKLLEESSLLKSHQELSEFKKKALAGHELLTSQLISKSKNISSLETRVSHFEKVIDDLKSTLNNERICRQQNMDRDLEANNENVGVQTYADIYLENISLIAALSEEQEEVIRQKEINGLAQLSIIRKDNEITNLLKCNSSLLEERRKLESTNVSISEELQGFETTFDKVVSKYGKDVRTHGDCALSLYVFLSNTLCNNFKTIDEYFEAIKINRRSQEEEMTTNQYSALSTETLEKVKTKDLTSVHHSPTTTPAETSSKCKRKGPFQSANIVKMLKLASDEEEDVNVEC